MKALIFAAGMGTRLKPITDRVPKALVPVYGKPLLWHVIEKLKAEGFKEIVINVHHFTEQIRQYVASCGSFGIDIHFSDETDLLRETGGGIKHASMLLNNDTPFLVHNVDILSNLNIKEFVKAHICKGVFKTRNFPVNDKVREHFNEFFADDRSFKGCAESMPLATLLVSDRKTERYLLFNADNRLAGWMNIKTGEVRSPYQALQREAGEGAIFGAENEYFNWQEFVSRYNLKMYAFDGAHVISPQIFEFMEDWPKKFSIIDFYLKICNRCSITYHIQPNLKMIDVGKVDSLQKAEELALELLKEGAV